MVRTLALSLAAVLAAAAARAETLTGQAAYGDWKSDAPGVARRITAADMPAPNLVKPAFSPPALVPEPAGAAPKAPPGFVVSEFAKLDSPRIARTAPDGDVFVAESLPGRIVILRAPDGAPNAAQTFTFAEGLSRPYGIAFYPAGASPEWVYVGETNRVVRFPYRNGDVKARGVPTIASEGGAHWTRDIVFSADGRTMFVSVGSASNIGTEMATKAPAEAAAWLRDHPLGAAWGPEEDRADVLAFDPAGGGRRQFATGLRNCAGLALSPATQALWCSTNERDLLGDDLPPDYVTRVREGAFYGWPWYYIGDHPDPRLAGQRPDLAGKAAVPDVLIQPHSAPLGITFYGAVRGPAAFPPAWRGDAFVALHGSWDRAKRTGYKVIAIPTQGGRPTGDYEDFLTGFVVDAKDVWGRPVGIAVARDGALIVTEDGSGTVWRVAWGGK